MLMKEIKKFILYYHSKTTSDKQKLSNDNTQTETPLVTNKSDIRITTHNPSTTKFIDHTKDTAENRLELTSNISFGQNTLVTDREALKSFPKITIL